MNRKIKLVALSVAICMLFIATAFSGAVGEPTIDHEVIDIGTGGTCFSFAIFADPQSDITNLTAAVNWVNANADSENIRFVIVAGDLIQGEKATANEYKNEYTNVNNNGVKDILDTLNVPYIPVIGNHDVWCNLYTTPIPFPDSSGSIPPYTTTTTYPEEIFGTVFGPVYSSLATTLAGWTKQDGMPISPNPHSPTYPDTYFQNFAFDYGDYRFVCIDFCARDDFKPDDWEIIINGIFPVPITKYQFGYARIQTAYDNDGTIKWFEDQLEKYGYCNPDRYDRGYKRSKNILLFSHHAPTFYLNGTGKYYGNDMIWDLKDENTYGFNESGRNEYSDLKNLLNSLSAHGFNYHWFTGHYEVKNMSWTDTLITPPDGVSVNMTASVQPLSWVPDDPNLTVDPNITINKQYFVKTKNNTNGSITIVRVLSPGGTDPDPSIYNPERHAQHSEEWPLPVVWDNPDIELYDLSGNFVPSGQLDYGKKYEIRATIYNKGCSEAVINVNFTWSKEALNWVDNLTGFTGGFNPPNYNKKGPITIPSGEERVVNITWNTSVVAAGPGPTTIHACVRAIIEPISIDSNSNNNRGQENCDVRGCEKAESDKVIEFSFPIRNPTNITNGITVDVYPEVGRLWNPFIILPEFIPPYWEGNVTLRLHPTSDPLGVIRNVNVGDSEIFSLTARRGDTNEITGGLDVKVIVDDPPILEWAGNIGYQTDGVEPDEGNAGTTFTFRVKYKDENNHAPASGYPLLYLFKGDKQFLGSPFVMKEEDQTDTVYTDGKIYNYSIVLTEPGEYAHCFWARDRLGIEAEGPATNLTSGPLVKEIPKVPALTPLGLIALIGILSVIAVISIRRIQK